MPENNRAKEEILGVVYVATKLIPLNQVRQ